VSRSTLSKIQSAAARRQREWLKDVEQRDPVLVSRMTARLDELYAERRHDLATRPFGTKDEVIRRARVERELEKLMGD